MDSFDIKVEKANAILRYNRLQKITALFRVMEVCIFLFIVSKISNQVPFVLKFSSDFFRGISITMFSPGFVFILGNAIVLVLFFKSSQISSQQSNCIEFCTSYVESCEKRMNTINQKVDKIKKQGRQVRQGKQSKCVKEHVMKNLSGLEDKTMHRSKSVDLQRYQHENSQRELRQPMTEKCWKSVNYNGVNSCAEDEMNGEEFRRTVEAFISRHQRSLREEEMSAIVTFGA